LAESPPRVFLLTPYTGGNLGDRAIQLTLIENLRKRCPNADFIGLTLNPRATAAIHSIP
jgi:polysaccharide pyruvyl transferase WcaK-like protein